MLRGVCTLRCVYCEVCLLWDVFTLRCVYCEMCVLWGLCTLRCVYGEVCVLTGVLDTVLQKPAVVAVTTPTSSSLCSTGKLLSTGWGKIKYPNTKIAVSQKCLNIFAPNLAHLFGTILCTNVLLCAVLLDICQIDGNANFKNKFYNWTKSWFYYWSNWATSTTFVVTSLVLVLRTT